MHCRYVGILATKNTSYTAFYFSFQLSTPNAMFHSNYKGYNRCQTVSQMLGCVLQAFSLPYGPQGQRLLHQAPPVFLREGLSSTLTFGQLLVLFHPPASTQRMAKWAMSFFFPAFPRKKSTGFPPAHIIHVSWTKTFLKLSVFLFLVWIRSFDNLEWEGPQDISCPTSFSREDHQPWGQTR